jgi:hypothetical protein
MDRVACRCGAYVVVAVVLLVGWPAVAQASGSWSVQQVGAAPGADDFFELRGVSCVSSRDCVAVSFSAMEDWKGLA